MAKLQLRKTPGYVYDLMYLFFIYFNSDFSSPRFATSEEVRTAYERLRRDFGDCAEELYLFFRVRSNGTCFLKETYAEELKCIPTSDSDPIPLLAALSDKERLIRSLTKYYFPAFAENADPTADGAIFNAIKTSEYSNVEKLKLYEFFHSPASHADLLLQEMNAKAALLSTYYQKNSTVINECYRSLSQDTLIPELAACDGEFEKVLKDEKCKERYVSVCLLHEGLLHCHAEGERAMLILGVHYQEALERYKNTASELKVYEFGAALGELNRVKILELMLEWGEISCKDLEREFRFSGSTAYHHLMTMLHCGVIKSRYVGKTVFYSIHTENFGHIIEALKTYANAKPILKETTTKKK